MEKLIQFINEKSFSGIYYLNFDYLMKLINIFAVFLLFIKIMELSNFLSFC